MKLRATVKVLGPLADPYAYVIDSTHSEQLDRIAGVLVGHRDKYQRDDNVVLTITTTSDVRTFKLADDALTIEDGTLDRWCRDDA